MQKREKEGREIDLSLSHFVLCFLLYLEFARLMVVVVEMREGGRGREKGGMRGEEQRKGSIRGVQ